MSDFYNNRFFQSGTFFQDFSTVIPAEYDSITFSGAFTIDKVRILSRELTDDEINQLTVFEDYTWTPDTLMYAEFNNNLSAGNIFGVTDPPTGWRVFRREVGSTTSTLLATLPIAETSYLDYSALPNTNYVYDVFLFSDNQQSQPIETDAINSRYFNFVIHNIDTKESFVFDNNPTFSGFGNTVKTTSYDVDDVGNQYYKHEKDFLTASLSAVISETAPDGSNNTINQSREFLNRLRSTINGNNNVVFKDRKDGLIMRVFTTGYSESTALHISLPNQPRQVSCTIEQLPNAEVNNIG